MAGADAVVSRKPALPRGAQSTFSRSKNSGPVVRSLAARVAAFGVICFTGSTEVGRIACTLPPTVLKPRLELGGNAPLIVFE